MTRLLRWLIPGLLAAVSVGCQPPPADVTTVVGDSLTMTTHGVDVPAGGEVTVEPWQRKPSATQLSHPGHGELLPSAPRAEGWRESRPLLPPLLVAPGSTQVRRKWWSTFCRGRPVEQLGWQAEDAQPGITARVVDPARSPCAAAIALGHNDAVKHSDGRGDGWTATDAAQMRRLRDTFHPTTKVLWVLPDYTGADPVYRASMETFRMWVRAEALRHGDLVADWRPAHTAADIEPDGAHLTPTGRRAYGALITQEMPRCG